MRARCPCSQAKLPAAKAFQSAIWNRVLQELVRADILAGVRGPRGGYRLARERRRISIGDIVRVVRSLESGTDPLSPEDEEGEERGAPLGRQVVRPLWQTLREALMIRLDTTTIEDLCEKAREAGISSEISNTG